jgi:hypothetical protein
LDETQKKWARSQGREEMVDKPRPRRNGQEAKGDKQKPIKHNKKTV